MKTIEKKIISELNIHVGDAIAMVDEYIRAFNFPIKSHTLQDNVKLLAGMNETACYRHAPKLGITAEDVKRVMQFRKLRDYRSAQLERILDAIREDQIGAIIIESPDEYLQRLAKCE